MRPASLAVRSVVATAVGLGTLGVGIAATSPPAAAAADGLQVTTDGVSFERLKNDPSDRDRRVGYSIRSPQGWRYEWLTEPLPDGRPQHVAFSAAAATMPDGYCVVYVRVPGAGDWHEESGGTRCTTTATDAAPQATATPDPPSAPEPDPAPSPSAADADAGEGPVSVPKAEAGPVGGGEATPSASSAAAAPSATPTPSPTPTVTASPSPSPSLSPSPSAGASMAAAPASPRPLTMDTGQIDALGRSFSTAPSSGDDASTADEAATDGTLWAVTGLSLAAAGLAVGGLVVWRGRRRST